jgi:hypothetical protein
VVKLFEIGDMKYRIGVVASTQIQFHRYWRLVNNDRVRAVITFPQFIWSIGLDQFRADKDLCAGYPLLMNSSFAILFIAHSVLIRTQILF